MAVRMELSRVLIHEMKDLQIIELREVETPLPDDLELAVTDESGKIPEEPGTLRTFPIVIGSVEAQAIERRLKGISVKRPLTHDLLANVVEALGAKLESITINDLSEHTFFATLDVKKVDGELIHIDCRPSDAIALGIANNVPIYVEDHVLDSATNNSDEQA